MRKYITPFICFLLIQLSSFAQKGVEAVLNNSKELHNATFGKKDSVVLERLLDEKLTYGHSGGKLETKKEMIKGVMASTATYSDLLMDSVTVAINRKTAVVRYVLKATSLDKGKESKLHLGIILVWINHKKVWTLLARQAYKL